MSSTYSKDSGVPVEYLMFELGLREGLGRKMADVVLGQKCCENVLELPEELPEIDKITSYIQMAQEKRLPDGKFQKLKKAAISAGKSVFHKVLNEVADPVEELLPEVERLLGVTGELYKAHRTVIYNLRDEYGTRYAPKEIPKLVEEEGDESQGEADETLTLGALIKNAMESGKKKKGEEIELAKQLQVEIGNKYFEQFTSLVEKDILLDYVTTVFEGVRKFSVLTQLSSEEMNVVKKMLLKKGGSIAKGVIDQLTHIYTSDSALVASFMESVLGLFDVQDSELVEEGITWLEGGITHLVTSLYED